MEALNSKGDRVAELYGSVDALAPGQTANLDLGGFVEGVDKGTKLTCKVLSVDAF